MKRFSRVKRILSLFLGAMSFGSQGSYAAKRRNGEKPKLTRANKLGRNKNDVIKVIKDAKNRGHDVKIKKLKNGNGKVTIRDKNGNTSTYIVGGLTALSILGVLGYLKFQKSGKNKEDKIQGEKTKEKASDEANTRKDLLDAVHALLEQGADLNMVDLGEYKELNFDNMCVEDLKVHMANLENSVKKSRENKRLFVRIMLKICPDVHGMNDVDGYLGALEDMTLYEMYKKSFSDMRVVQLYSLLNIVDGHDGEMWKLLNFNSEDDAFLELGKWSTEDITALSNAVAYWKEAGFSEDFKLLDIYDEIQHNDQKFGK